jgi:hypothetical protein
MTILFGVYGSAEAESYQSIQAPRRFELVVNNVKRSMGKTPASAKSAEGWGTHFGRTGMSVPDICRTRVFDPKIVGYRSAGPTKN